MKLKRYICDAIHGGLERKILRVLPLLLLLMLGGRTFAQRDSIRPFTTFYMKVRAEANYHHQMRTTPGQQPVHLDNTYGLAGRYFVIRMAGELSSHFSYFFHHNIVPHPGSVRFFDNTDFLFLNCRINDRWSVRVGKEALALGGFEYDKPAIDVPFSTYYWDNIYCFQPSVGVSYTSKNQQNTLRLQVANSPYAHYNSPFGSNSLLSYNFMWMGNFKHFHTLYSVSMFQRDKAGHFMNYIALGNQLAYDKWSIYVDLLHHATSTRSWLRDFGIVCRADVFVTDYCNLYVKGSYEQNRDRSEWDWYAETGELWDCLAFPGQRYFMGGVGFELRVPKCPEVMFYGFVADVCKQNDWLEATSKSKDNHNASLAHDLTANVGVTWTINFLKYLKNR